MEWKKATYKKDDGTKKSYWYPTKSIVNDEVARNGREYYRGERGDVIDRVMQKLYDRDPFGETGLKA